jgi:hypothetical protein
MKKMKLFLKRGSFKVYYENKKDSYIIKFIK